MEENLQKIYTQISDTLSKEIFIDRLNYSVTHEYHYLEKMVDRTVRSRTEWKKFCGLLQDRAQSADLYLFGAGIWGNTLYQETKGQIQWRGVIDNQPGGKAMADLEVMTLEQFMERRNDHTTVVISSYKNGPDMKGQLQDRGFCPDRILDAGRVIHDLTEGAIYFDLGELHPQAEGEYFVDAGGFDGLTTLAFLNWCGGNGHSYCFEADRKNITLIRNKLGNNTKCEIIPRALWSETASLSMRMEGTCGSAVTDKGNDEGTQEVGAAALDDILGDRPVTFIKMDIEGAELEAIRGARHIIQTQHPKLAVSIYHRYEDIWTIPSQIMEYDSGYRFYLRHYSFSDYDTVLYAVPQNSETDWHIT